MWFKSLCVLIIELVGMAGHVIVGVGFEEVDLELQFVRVGPVVVALAHGDVFCIGVHGGTHDVVYAVTWFAELVLGLVDGLDDVGVLLGVLTDDGCRAVCRSVVVNNGLEGECSLLHHKAVQALPQIRLMVID